ncbi:MAG TPA: recombinase family protein [Gemmataceae bacterium]|nr:recombinase family protein [Gemmataceae bacterium]
MNNQHFRAALYARVSSEQQAKDNTVASQLSALKDRIKKDRLRLDPELCFVDEGYSGSTLIRPALERLRDQVAAGSIDRLYVHSPDRLARKYAYQVLLVDEFQRQGVEIIFLNHTIGSSPEEDLLLQVQGMVAEYERAKILERSRRGKRHAARAGSVNVLSGAPFGYRYISKQDGAGQARYEILPAEAEVVQKVFTWVGRDRCSIGEVCRRLQAEGIPTRTGKTAWDRTTVWGMLKNPAYHGEAAFGKTRTVPLRPRLRTQRGKPAQPRRASAHEATPPEEQVPIAVPALVSAELFAAVAEQLAENQRRRRQSHRGARHLLQGLVVCQQCGYAYYGKPVSRPAAKGKARHYAYYRCIGTDAYRFGGERLCQNPQVRTDLVEAVVWEDVCALLANPSRVKAEYQRRLSRKQKEAGRASSQVARLVAQVQRSLTRLIDAYEEGLLTKSEFEPRMRAARERLAKLQAEATAAQHQETEEQQLEAVLGRLEEFAQHVEQRLAEADWTTRREIIRALVKQVEIGDEAVRVVYKVPPPPFVDGPHGGRLQDRLGRDDSAWRGALLGGEQSFTVQHSRLQPRLDEAT